MNNKKVFDFIGYRKILFLIPIVIAVITVISHHKIFILT